MALKKIDEVKKADYWRVDIVDVNKLTKEGSCLIQLHDITKEALSLERVRNGRAVRVYEEEFDKYFGADAEFKDIYEAAYQMVKDKDEYFADAEDC